MKVIVRTTDTSESAAIAALLNAHSEALYGETDLAEAAVREWFSHDDIAIRLGEVGGVAVCYGDLGASDGGARAELDVREHPEHPGSSRAMLVELERLAVERGFGAVRAYALSEDASLLGVLAERRYRPIRHSFRMLISLDAAIPEPQWPEGIVVRTVAEGEERQTHAADQDAFRDHWDFEPRPYERWARWTFESERFDRSLNFLALDGAQIAGVCLCSIHFSGDPTHGWVGSLGVRPPWRRRGLGLALLQHAFREFRGRGCDRVGLGVDGQSTTGALELYERAGMHVARRTDALEKSL